MGCLCSLLQQLQCSKILNQRARVQPTSMTESRRTINSNLIDILPYYWGDMTDEDTKKKLLLQPSGAFLLRSLPSTRKSKNSDSNSYLISFKRFKTVVSLEILTDEGFYFLGTERHHPHFQSLEKLVNYYTNLSPTPRMLETPLVNRVLSLQELCYFVIKLNINTQKIAKLHLPKLLKERLKT